MSRLIHYCVGAVAAASVLLSSSPVDAQQGFRCGRCAFEPCGTYQLRRSPQALARTRGDFAPRRDPPQTAPVESSFNRCGVCGGGGGG